MIFPVKVFHKKFVLPALLFMPFNHMFYSKWYKIFEFKIQAVVLGGAISTRGTTICVIARMIKSYKKTVTLLGVFFCQLVVHDLSSFFDCSSNPEWA